MAPEPSICEGGRSAKNTDLGTPWSQRDAGRMTIAIAEQLNREL
jgi:hypothetical protein